MYDASQLYPRSPQSARSRATPTCTRRSPARLLSPTKTHLTPSRTRQISPRKSPAKKSIFDTMSSQAVHFTPERTKQPPRAWERRPATPYVPRDDKQKIWKRVPLGEIGIEPNRPVNISRRDQQATKDYVRVVKKLKIGHGSSDDEDKENVSLDVKVDCDDGNIKRKPCLDSRFVSMKMEEDDIVGSPKKKLRSYPSRCDSADQDNAREETETGSEAEDEIETCEEHSQGSVEHNEFEGQHAPNEELVLLREDNATEDEQFAANTAEISPRLNACTVDSASSNSRTDASEREQEVIPSHGPDASLIDSTSGNLGDVEIIAINSIPAEESLEHESAMNTPETSESTVPKNQDLPSHPLETSTRESVSSCDEYQDNDMEVDRDEVQSAFPEEPRSSSPPTILAENVVIDELESRNASQEAISTADQTISLNDQQEEDASDFQEVQQPAPRRISDDEAAFLRNFVSNSKAERAARERKVQDTLVDESNIQAEDVLEGATDLHESFDEEPQLTQGTPNLEPSATSAGEIVLSSPLRRSKRAAITSIPRPQILPNAIQLKRANGNEFIFTANKASSVANIAVVTRSNTKRNKGSALTVPERLEQLLAGDVAVDENDEAAKIEPEPSNNRAGENSGKSSATKKRKRDAKDGATRAKKVLRWNDEKLVSYQEAKRFMDEAEDIDDSSQESNPTREDQTTDSDKHVKLTLTLTSSGSDKSSSKDEKDSSHSTSQSKVRRVRRGTSGTVNGTPGPKTRSRRIPTDEDTDLNTDIPTDDNGSLEDSTAATAAINELAATAEVSKLATATKRSRMPMPVTSNLGTRRGAAASASIRSGSVAMRAGAATAGPEAEPKKAKETGKSQGPKDDAKGGDLLGKRRLRVRS